MRTVLIRVHPDFRKKLRIKMAEGDFKNLPHLTACLAEGKEYFENKKKEKQKNGLFPI